MLLKTLESPLDCKENQPVLPKGDQSWIFIGRTDTEAETPVLWPPDVKSWLIWKDPDSGKDWRQEEKGMTENKMVGWHHRLNGHEFGSTLGVCDGQGSLACCSSWNRRVGHDWATELNWTCADTVCTLSCLIHTILRGRNNSFPSFYRQDPQRINSLLLAICKFQIWF